MHPNTRARITRQLNQPQQEVARLLRRADCQIAFARAFASLFPDRQNEWAALIDAAQGRLDALELFGTGSGGIETLAHAVQEAERILEPIGVVAKTYTVHCVGHGHIDMNWMWSWPETVAATHDTFASVLSLMEQYPDLTYSQSQAAVYALTEKYQPAQFEAIKKRVAEGRWEVTAAHWVEGDKNLASGESICRHLLYSRRYCAEKFGLSASDVPLDWEPDTFGHANTIPTILAEAGVKYYYACRVGGGFDHAISNKDETGPRPRLFWWEGTNGSRVLVNRESTWYNSYVNIGDNVALPLVEFCRETGLKDFMNVFGLGNHGGGPTRVEIDYLIEMRDWPIYPQVRFNKAKGWFQLAEEAVSPDLPVLAHELNYEFTGCYTSQSLIKQANRWGENYLEEAETLAAVSSRVFGAHYPESQLRDGWLNVLFNQFHDILPGSGVRQTRDAALAGFQEVGAITGSIKRAAGIALAKSINTIALLPDTPEGREERALYETGAANTPFVAGAGIKAMESGYSVASGGGVRFKPFVVYNPCAWERSEAVTVTLYDTDFEPGRIVARDETGINHPTLFLGRGADWGHQKITVLFFARNVPALGYKTFLLCEGQADASDTPHVSIENNATFQTPYLTLKADRYGSGFLEVTDKRTGECFGDSYQPTGRWQTLVEAPRGMTAWVLGNESNHTALKSTGFGVTGGTYNQGTGAAQGNNIAYVITRI